MRVGGSVLKFVFLLEKKKKAWGGRSEKSNGWRKVRERVNYMRFPNGVTG